MPVYQRVQERCWLAAMARILAFGRLQDDLLLDRVDAQCARGAWSAARQRALAQELLHGHVRPRGRIDPERQVWLVARLDPEALAGLDAPQAAIAFEALADCPRDLPSHVQAARILARRQPAVFVREAADAQEAIPRWLPLPEQADLLCAVLPEGDARSRAALLVACEQRYPGKVAAAILALPPDSVTPVERGFLRRHYDDAERLIAALPPAEAAAWSAAVASRRRPRRGDPALASRPRCMEWLAMDIQLTIDGMDVTVCEGPPHRGPAAHHRGPQVHQRIDRQPARGAQAGIERAAGHLQFVVD